MPEDRLVRGLVVVGAVVLVVIMAAALIHGFVNTSPGGSRQITKTFLVGAHPLLVITGRNSNVDVHSGSAGSTTVQIRAHNSDASLDAGTELRSNQALDSQGYDRLSVTTSPAYEDADYVVTVPAAARVQVSVDSGAIVVNGVSGASVDTGSGGLDIANVRGPVNARTDSGDITARNINGAMTIAGESGSLHISDVTGSLSATTQSGDVIAQDANLRGQSALKTTNGSVRFAGTLATQASYTMQTSSGDVDVMLPANAALQLNASTASGNIYNAFGSNITGGPARAQLSATVMHGSVTIEKAA